MFQIGDFVFDTVACANVQILEKTGICTFVVSIGLQYNWVVLKGRNRFHLTRPEI